MNSQSEREQSVGNSGKTGESQVCSNAAENIDQILLEMAAQLPESRQIEQLISWKRNIDWLSCFQHSTRLLMAAIEPGTLRVRYANEGFCRLTGIEADTAGAGGNRDGSVHKKIILSDLFPELDKAAQERLYRRHVLHLVLSQLYQIDLREWRLLDEPVTVPLNSPLYQEPRYIEFWLDSDQLKVSRIKPKIDEFADLKLQQLGVGEGSRPVSELSWPDLERRLKLENYRIEGLLLLEGFDVTEQEIMRRLTQLLIERDSILRPDKFKQINRGFRALFRAQNTVILSGEREPAQIFWGEGGELSPAVYAMQSLQGSHFLRAAPRESSLERSRSECGLPN